MPFCGSYFKTVKLSVVSANAVRKFLKFCISIYFKNNFTRNRTTHWSFFQVESKLKFRSSKNPLFFAKLFRNPCKISQKFSKISAHFEKILQVFRFIIHVFCKFLQRRMKNFSIGVNRKQAWKLWLESTKNWSATHFACW